MLTCRDVSLARKARYIYSFYEAIMFIIDAPVDIRRYLESPITLKEIIPDNKLMGHFFILENCDTKLWRIQAILVVAIINTDLQELIKIKSELDPFYQEQLQLSDSSLSQETVDAFKKMLSDLITNIN